MNASGRPSFSIDFNKLVMPDWLTYEALPKLRRSAPLSSLSSWWRFLEGPHDAAGRFCAMKQKQFCVVLKTEFDPKWRRAKQVTTPTRTLTFANACNCAHTLSMCSVLFQFELLAESRTRFEIDCKTNVMIKRCVCRSIHGQRAQWARFDSKRQLIHC